MIYYTEKAPSADEYNLLTDAVGWGVSEVDTIETALANSLYCVCAYDGEKIERFGFITREKAGLGAGMALL